MMRHYHEKVNREGLQSFLSTHPHTRGIIVCPERKFIYMKATKTAGTSILRGVLEKQIPGIFHKKDHPEIFQKWMDTVSDQELEKYFIFTIIRNPWDRAVSIARYFNLSLKDFLHNYESHISNPAIRIHSLPLYLYTHYQEQRFCDLICRFESLQADMNLVFDRIGLPRQQLPFLNSSDRGQYVEYYGQNEIAQVSKIYARDIQYFGYMFDHSSRASKESDRKSAASWFLRQINSLLKK